jgi:fructuronate reductase
VRLSPQTLDRLPAGIARPEYDFAAQASGIVHLGIGAFHRAHQAVYTDAAMGAGERDWRITGVSLRSAGVHDQLAPQGGLYTVTVKGEGEPQTRVIGSVGRVLVAPRAPQAVVEALADAGTRIVSFTVTEKGYHQAASGELDRTNAGVAADLSGSGPATIYGFLRAGLALRRERGLGGLTLLSCDNLPENGRRLEALLLTFLDEVDPQLADWCRETCAFPCSMVDRIVPATTEADLAEVALRLGLEDEGAVVAEPFSQWVIEDRFAGARPGWDHHGAELVADVEPYETAKLRMLNGSHSAMAYLGLAKGLRLASEAIADPEIGALVGRLMREEAATSFPAAPGQDLEVYARQLEARFANPALPHRLQQIAMDGSQKIPQRWLATLAAHQRVGRDCPSILEALAAWIVFVRGDRHEVDDPLAEKLAALWQQAGGEGIVRALFGRGGLFSANWTADEAALLRLEAKVLRRS